MTTTAPAVGTALRYIGPRPERDVPSWMHAPVSFRRDLGFGVWEVMASDGSRTLDAADLAPLAPVNFDDGLVSSSADESRYETHVQRPDGSWGARRPGTLWERVDATDRDVTTPNGRYVASRARIARRNGAEDRGPLAIRNASDGLRFSRAARGEASGVIRRGVRVK